MDLHIKKFIIEPYEVQKTIRFRAFNNWLAMVYRDFANSYKDSPFGDKDENKLLERRYTFKADRVEDCNKFWKIDYFQKQGIKERKSAFLCGDKFCLNCQKVRQLLRLRKYEPIMNEKLKDYDLYHMVLSIKDPLVNNNFAFALDRMKTSFQYLIRYLSGRNKIKGLDFKQYGYGGAFLSLEVGVSNVKFHPHYHVILALKKDLGFEYNIENRFSFSKQNGYQLFSDFEVLIQKIWYLLNNGIEVNFENIEKQNEGYSCQCKIISDGNYHEAFKYITKVEEEGFSINEKTFFVLDKALDNRRLVQSYGCFHGLGDVEINENEFVENYNKLRDKLCLVESPVEVSEPLNKILFFMVMQNCLYISASKIHSLLVEFGAFDDIDTEIQLEPLEVVKYEKQKLTPEQISIADYLCKIYKEVLADKDNKDNG